MRSHLALLPLVALACTTAPAPTPTANPAMTDSSGAHTATFTIHPVLHATLVIQQPGLTIVVDPAQCADALNAYPPPDLVLITDVHGDHLDTATLAALDLGKAALIAPQAVVDLLPERFRKMADPLRNGARAEAKGIGVEAVPMYNMPDPNDPRHPRGRGNGYVLTINGQRLYVSGDTEDIPEMRALKNIDIAFVCMNLPYTMPVEKAAEGVLAFHPRVVYPYHYRNQDGSLSDVARFKQLVHAGDPAIEVRLAEWYPQPTAVKG